MLATFPVRPPDSTRGEFSTFDRRTMSISRHSSTVTMAPWRSASSRRMLITDCTGNTARITVSVSSTPWLLKSSSTPASASTSCTMARTLMPVALA